MGRRGVVDYMYLASMSDILKTIELQISSLRLSSQISNHQYILKHWIIDTQADLFYNFGINKGIIIVSQ